MIFYNLWFFLHCEDPLRGINTCVEPDLAPRTDQNLQLVISRWLLASVSLGPTTIWPSLNNRAKGQELRANCRAKGALILR